VYSLPEKDWSSSRLNKLEKVCARERARGPKDQYEWRYPETDVS
jgi:hypothetical protein